MVEHVQHIEISGPLRRLAELVRRGRRDVDGPCLRDFVQEGGGDGLGLMRDVRPEPSAKAFA